MGLGVTFLVSAFTKTKNGWLSTGDPLIAFIQKQQDAAVPFYMQFLTDVVGPNAGTVAQLVVIGEWVTGISLTIGLLTRLGAIVCGWLVLNYGLAKGVMTPEATDDRVIILAAFAVGAAAAGLVWGLDGILLPALTTNPLTRWLAGAPKRISVLREPEFLPGRRSRAA